jgi:uncharacterized surface protein with fasciclin (FAS1) repeats
MCMKDRLFRIRRLLLGAMALLLTGGLMYSCSDDYDLPDKTPGWLGSSIYNYLKEQGNFTNTVKLIDDLDYAEVLAKTGSKTLFAADDDAYNRFFAKNPWGVHQYSDLTMSQKKLLLNSCMLDNAYLLEMMPNLSSGSLGTDGTYLDRNRCLRQPTSVSVTDSITYFNWDNPAIPTTNNLGLKNAGSNPDKDYWVRFRTQAKGGIRMATDATTPLMVHWIAGQMGEQNITDDDFKTIVGKARESNDVYIFGSKVVKQDITCQNGYVDQLDEVYTTPTNMAEMIRTNGRTSLFSHMLDRFSAPYYNSSLTASYRQLNPGVDSVFEKRYLSARSQGGGALERDPKGNKVTYYLNYDPGWNTYFNASHGVQVDMGAMFVPSDAAMQKYFLTGGGVFLMNAYAVQKPVTAENLQYNLDQIPLSVIQALINNLMKTSFIESVPSKYITIMNDARDPMFSNATTVDAFKQKIDTCLIANNGVVYILNEVYTPASYASVSAPALVGDSLRIFNWAITADDKYITNPTSAPLNSFISAYLLAMSTNFSFFIPTDNALQTYYDPVSMAHTQPYVLVFKFDSRSASTPVTARAKKYDKVTGEIDSTGYMTTTISATIVNNRLKDMLDAHIIVDTTASKLGVNDGNHYYVSKGGAPIKVERVNDGINGMTVYGGWQIDHPGQACHVKEIFDKSEKTNGYGNGMTYIIDHPIESTIKSVYSIMGNDGNEDSPYYQFFQLCQVDAAALEDAGLADAYSKRAEKDKALAKYYIFTGNNPCLDQNVRFFNTYRYTVYIPTNESVQEAINQGLPTWSTISAYIQERKDYIAAHENDGTINVDTLTAEYKTKAQAMITCLLNFIKYHFQDNSIFLDNNPISSTAYETACINNVTNRYITVTVSSEGNQTLSVTDKAGHTRQVITENGQDGNYNMLARDMELNRTGESASTIETSSYAVLHRINGVLNFKALTNNRYDSDWATTSKARKFIAKYRIRK